MLGTVNHSAPNLPILATTTTSNSSTCGSHHSVCSSSIVGQQSSQMSSPSIQATSEPVSSTVQQQVTSQTRQLFNNSSVKLMQRLLDEASQTGELLLTARNLTEFPSKLALVYDLSDTIYAGNHSLII